MFVKSVEGTVKGNVNAELGRLTIIVGPNGSGKSRLVNTLELALLGYASDVVGRAEMRKESELIALAGGLGDNLVAKATLDDGRVCQWSTAKSKTGTKRAEHIKAVAAEFPVNHVREALTGSVDTARTWLLQRVAAKVSRADVTKYFNSDDAETVYSNKAKFFTGDEIQTLLGVYDAVKSEKRAKSAAVTTTGKNIATLAEGLPPEPTEAQLNAVVAQAEAALADYRAAIEANTRSLVVPQPLNPVVLDQLYARAVEIAELVETAAKEKATAQDEYDFLGGALDPASRVLFDLRSQIVGLCETHTKLGIGSCLACEQPFPALNANARASALTRLNEGLSQREAATIALEAAADVERKVREAFEHAVKEYNAARQAQDASVPPDANATFSVDAAAESLRQAQALRSEVERTAEAWKSVRSLRTDERDAKKAVNTLEEVIEGCKSAIEGILKSATQQFIDRVQSFLPASDRFALVLSEGDKDVCRFGFVRDGSLHTALSGAEWARLTLALACACSSDSADTLRVFVPEDRAFDAKTLRDVLIALTDAPGQVIIATTTMPAGRLPKGWTLVQTGATE
jgi:energy-coupling factor transporter ATP-binding protein EcfA2